MEGGFPSLRFFMKKYFLILLLVFIFSVPVSAYSIDEYPDAFNGYVTRITRFPFNTVDNPFIFDDGSRIYRYGCESGNVAVFRQGTSTGVCIASSLSTAKYNYDNVLISNVTGLPSYSESVSLRFTYTYDGKTVYYTYFNGSYSGFHTSSLYNQYYSYTSNQSAWGQLAWLMVYGYNEPEPDNYIYQAGLGTLKNVSFNQRVIKETNENYLGVTYDQFTTTDFDLSTPGAGVEARIGLLDVDTSDNSYLDSNFRPFKLFSKFWSQGLTDLFTLPFDLITGNPIRTLVDVYLTPTYTVGNTIYYGDSYIISDVYADRVGTTIFDNYMSEKDNDSGETVTSTNLNSSTVYIGNIDLSTFTEVGDTITINYNNYQSNDVYNYTTIYNTTNIYNEYENTTNYQSGPTVVVGPARPSGPGVDFYDNFNWSKFMTSLLSFFTTVTVLLPLLTNLLSFLPVWAIGLLESCIMACLLFSLARGVFTIIKGVIS